MRSTFHGFSTALSGLHTSQKALDVTGQNISNMGTKGYTRQRLDLYSVNGSHYADMYSSRSSKAVGQGVGVTNVSQIRDPFLDVRFRREAAQTGEIDASLSVLEDLESLFDETQKDALGKQLADLKTQLQTLSTHTGFKEFDSIVRSSAESLTNLINQYSQQLSSIREQEEYNFDNVSVSNVNDILKNIGELNKSIKQSEIFGNPSLELMDQRNVLLDELSTYANINVTYTPTEIAPGTTVNVLTVDFMGKNSTIRLLDDEKIATVSSGKDPLTGHTTLSVSNSFAAPPAPATLDLTNELTTGIFKGSLDSLNQSGQFDNPTTSANGIGYYEKRLDLLASNFSDIMNKANSIENPYHDPNVPLGKPIPDPNKPGSTMPNPALYDSPGAWRPLFGTNDGSTAITSKNICIASGWKNNDYMISASKDGSITGTSTDGKSDNILKMIALFGQDSSFSITKTVLGNDGKPVQATDKGGNPLWLVDENGQKILDGAGKPIPIYKTIQQSVFTGTFQEYFGDCNNVLALDVKSQMSSLDNHQSLLQGVADLRDSVSAVSLDEEGVNLLQFQKSYSAASRFMTALDQALDTLINRTGTVGL